MRDHVSVAEISRREGKLMLNLRSRLAPVIVPAVLVLLVAAIACEPVGQEPLNQDEIRQAVQAEVSFQIEAAKEAMFQDFGPFQGDMEFALMEPLNELRFEFDGLRNRLEGTDYVSRFDLDSLRLDLEQMGSFFGGLEFEYARRGDLDELRFEIDDISNNLALRDLELNQGSDLDQLRFEIDQTRAMIEDAQNESHLNLGQLRLEVEDMGRFLNEFQADFSLELDRLRLRVDSMR